MAQFFFVYSIVLNKEITFVAFIFVNGKFVKIQFTFSALHLMRTCENGKEILLFSLFSAVIECERTAESFQFQLYHLFNKLCCTVVHIKLVWFGLVWRTVVFSRDTSTKACTCTYCIFTYDVRTCTIQQMNHS